ncbi:hypothetical protein [Bosea sp. BH3]|uniref:hypothetical protein n=1 Tax=Bosea sp. BH3 TaxID=2871701 RepID=UPI0021CB8314|nr:hypothetical protein [Bosea sp. BH3]MCU4179045.1 hypothetical protein [Bosea sp. BH3]
MDQVAPSNPIDRGRRAFGLGLAACALNACGSGALTYRFRLAIEVIDEGKLKFGSSVIEVTNWVSGGWGSSEAGGSRASDRGETAFVDLGPKGHLVPLFVFPFPGTGFLVRLAPLAFGRVYPPRISIKQLSKLKGETELRDDLLPYLAVFPNPLDPESVRLVPGTDVSAILGSDSQFKRIYIEMTTDPPQIGNLQQRLPWVTDHQSAVRTAQKLASQGLSFGGALGDSNMFVRGK